MKTTFEPLGKTAKKRDRDYWPESCPFFVQSVYAANSVFLVLDIQYQNGGECFVFEGVWVNSSSGFSVAEIDSYVPQNFERIDGPITFQNDA